MKRDRSLARRSRLKEWLRGYPWLFRMAKEVMISAKIVRRSLRSNKRAQVTFPLQSIREIPLSENVTHVDELRTLLDKHGIGYEEGRHTLYLPPQEKLREIFEGSQLPSSPGCGYKILKRFATPEEATYLSESDNQAIVKLLGGIHTQARSMACLSVLDLGPRLEEVLHLKAGENSITALAVEHVVGRAPTVMEYRHFMDRLRELTNQGLLSLANPSGFECGDFEEPLCNGNLIIDEQDRPRYVDPQLFLFDDGKILDALAGSSATNLHFGNKTQMISRGREFLYQEIPGMSSKAKRGTLDRWKRIDELLSRHQMCMADATAFDICCNSGMMLGQTLVRGAKQAYGWDLPEVAMAGNMILQLLGAGRARLIAAEITEDHDFIADLPHAPSGEKDKICFFLAAWQHVGIPKGVGDLPWKWLIYEGHQDDDSRTTNEVLAKICESWNCEVLESTSVSDGLSDPRPLVLLARKEKARS